MTTKAKDDDGPRRSDDSEAPFEDLKTQAAALCGGQMRTWTSPDCPSGIEEQFWKQIVAFENAPEVEPFDMLIRSGLALPSPQELDDESLAAKLWEVVRGLECLGVYLSSTDHLNDRELYTRLWTDILREPIALEPEDEDGAWHVDLIGSGSEEDIDVYLKYYADEDERRRWAQEWPDHVLPRVAQRPFDRDRHLPSPYRS